LIPLGVWGSRRLPLELWLFSAASLAAKLLKQHTIGLERHGSATALPLMLYGARFRQRPRWVGVLRGLGSLLLALLTQRIASGSWIG